MEDHEGIIWAGTFNKGLYYYNPHDGKNGKFQHDTIKYSPLLGQKS